MMGPLYTVSLGFGGKYSPLPCSINLPLKYIFVYNGAPLMVKSCCILLLRAQHVW